MKLDDLREQINGIDEQIAELFLKRMELCLDVSRFKIENNMPIFQGGREKFILDKMADMFPDELKSSSQVLYQTIMDISKCRQYREFFAEQSSIQHFPLDMQKHCRVAVPGTKGSFSHIASTKPFKDADIDFYDHFEQVFEALENGKADFGVVPIANSTAGSVVATYELLKKYDLKICATMKQKITHCLAAKKGTGISDIKIVYSHEQALMQCSEFLKKHALKGHTHANTALAAEYAAQSDQPFGAICSKECAQLNGLDILAEDIANVPENFTRFIIISKQTLCSKDANIISVILSLPHEKSALYRLLTKFSVAGLNLTMIESRPIANTDFDVVFYLDFEGSIRDPQVAMLINELTQDLAYFKFLGNYEDITGGVQ